MQKITIASKGDAVDSGIDLTQAKFNGGGTGNATRGIYMGGTTGSIVNVIEFMTLASTSNFVDFGDLIQVTNSNGAVSSPTRAVTLGGSATSRINNIEYLSLIHI